MSIRSLVLNQIELVARQQEKALPTLTDTLPLLDSGLDSLCMAVLVANLEEELGVDPFSSSSSSMPRTVGEFIGMYENAAA
jgi:acyl carrier protein